MRYFYRNCVFSLAAMLVATPFIASANEVFPTSEYVVPIYQAENGNNHANEVMQINSNGYVERRAPVATINTAVSTDDNNLTTKGAVVEYAEDKDNKLDGGTGNTIADNSNDTTKYTSAAAVTQYAIQKPASAAEGQVLTYGTGANANSRPTAQYIKVPMANGDPTANGTTVSSTASIWLQ